MVWYRVGISSEWPGEKKMPKQMKQFRKIAKKDTKVLLNAAIEWQIVLVVKSLYLF